MLRWMHIWNIVQRGGKQEGIYAVAWLRKRADMDKRVTVGKVEDPLIGGWVVLDGRNISKKVWVIS